MNLNFTISEFCITDDPIDQNIANMILRWHILEIQKVRDVLQRPILVSWNSGFRPYSYEINRGRSGNSEHTFRGVNKHGIGAADYTLSFTGDRPKIDQLNELFDAIDCHTNYTRVAIYPNNLFIHCDYKADEKQLFRATPNWERI